MQRRNARSCRMWNIGKAAISTTVPRCRISRRGDENGRCSASSQPGMRNVFSRHTAGSTTTFSFAVTASLPSTIAPSGTRPSARGAMWPGFQRPRDTKPSWRQPTSTGLQVDNAVPAPAPGPWSRRPTAPASRSVQQRRSRPHQLLRSACQRDGISGRPRMLSGNR
jgi:hypothetical protein